MNEPKFGFIVEYVKDIEKSKNFYAETMGLKIIRECPVYVEFETFAIASDEPMQKGAKQEIYWLVEDINSIFNSISKKAEICLSIKQEVFGQVFGVKNPDGEPCYILELAKNRPSKEL